MQVATLTCVSLLLDFWTDKRNVSPKMTPDWTAESLDEYAKSRGRAISWARRAREGEFIQDPFETLDMTLDLRMYFILVAVVISFAFGRSTPTFLDTFLDVPSPETFSEPLQAPALALTAASLGSSILCGMFLAPERKRNSFYWAVKGFLGGPLAVSQLKGLNPLITREEDRNRRQEATKR